MCLPLFRMKHLGSLIRGLQRVGSVPDLPACLLSSCFVVPERGGGSGGSGGRGALGSLEWRRNPSGWHLGRWLWGSDSQQHSGAAALKRAHSRIQASQQRRYLSLSVFIKRLLCALHLFAQREGWEGL